MRKKKYNCFIIIIICVLLLSACNIKSNTATDTSQVTEKENENVKGGKTLEEAMDYYMTNVDSSKGITGAFYTGKYKIIYTDETSDMVNVYTCIVSRWVDTSGNTVSGGSGVHRIGFRKENNIYMYEEFQVYKVAVTPYVPQKVSDIISNDGKKIFDDLIVEVEKEIEKYLNGEF